MFFIGIFGIESREKELKRFTGIVCPCCGRFAGAVLFTSYTYFHIFFIPTFRWNRKYFVKTGCCGSLWEAPRDYAEQLKTSDMIDFSRLKKVSQGFCGFDNGCVVCPNCKRSFDKGYAYCPYCGTKQ